MSKAKLELTWVGKEVRPKLEPRILLEDPEKSYHADRRVSENDIFDNRLIFGDNLLVLKALEQEFSGKVKCVYIDPPFNTGQAFEHYPDELEHSIWLGLMRDRLEAIHNLLADDGTLFVHIDDNELGYLIALADEIFRRPNRLYVVTFKQGSATGHKAINPGCVNTTNFLLIYAKKKASWSPNRVYVGRDRDKRYGSFITNVEQDCTRWKIITLNSAFAASQGLTEQAARKRIKESPEQLDQFVAEKATSVIRLAVPDMEAISRGARAAVEASRLHPREVIQFQRDGYSDFYLLGGQRILFYKDKLKLIDGEYVAGEPLSTLWDDLLSNNLHNEGGVAFPKGKKPEALLQRVLQLATKPGDIVLDSFAGSGTTAAVAHKMRRRWISVELRDHVDTHIVPRLEAVVEGRDDSGITKAVNWKGGGGFRYYKLAPSLISTDKYGNEIINPEFNKEMLAEAVCKLEGFVYSPSDELYWLHGTSTESDFIYVTTQTLTHEQLQLISDEVGDERTLLICCAAFRGNPDAFPNLTVKKIPKSVLHKCQWDWNEYEERVKKLGYKAEKLGGLFAEDEQEEAE
jgi:adenine-specific DNA-methyltransferase